MITGIDLKKKKIKPGLLDELKQLNIMAEGMEYEGMSIECPVCPGSDSFHRSRDIFKHVTSKTLNLLNLS